MLLLEDESPKSANHRHDIRTFRQHRSHDVQAWQPTIRGKIDLVATGANIRRLRREKGLSVIKVQELLDVGDPQTVYQWEWGRNLPTIEHLIALSILLETPIEKLLVWSRPPPLNSQDLRQTRRSWLFFVQAAFSATILIEVILGVLVVVKVVVVVIVKLFRVGIVLHVVGG